jgi:hypothetical protein
VFFDIGKPLVFVPLITIKNILKHSFILHIKNKFVKRQCQGMWQGTGERQRRRKI